MGPIEGRGVGVDHEPPAGSRWRVAIPRACVTSTVGWVESMTTRRGNAPRSASHVFLDHEPHDGRALNHDASIAQGRCDPLAFQLVPAFAHKVVEALSLRFDRKLQEDVRTVKEM